MKEKGEEGIGMFITVEHHSPALMDDTVNFQAVIESTKGNEIICSYHAKVGRRLVATGRQGQKILKQEKIAYIFNMLKHG